MNVGVFVGIFGISCFIMMYMKCVKFMVKFLVIFGSLFFLSCDVMYGNGVIIICIGVIGLDLEVLFFFVGFSFWSSCICGFFGVYYLCYDGLWFRKIGFGS